MGTEKMVLILTLAFAVLFAILMTIIVWLTQPHVHQEQLMLTIPEGAEPGDRLAIKETFAESPLWTLIAGEPDPTVDASLIPQGAAMERADSEGAI